MPEAGRAGPVDDARSSGPCTGRNHSPICRLSLHNLPTSVLIQLGSCFSDHSDQPHDTSDTVGILLGLFRIYARPAYDMDRRLGYAQSFYGFIH